MSTFDYNEFVQLALDMLAEFGSPVVWQKPAPESVGNDPWRDERTGDAPRFTPNMVFFSPLDLARGRGQFAMFAKGSDIVNYTEVGLLAGGCGFVPDVADTLTRNGKNVQIVEIDQVSPTGIPVLYFIAVN